MKKSKKALVVLTVIGLATGVVVKKKEFILSGVQKAIHRFGFGSSENLADRMVELSERPAVIPRQS